MGGVKRGEQPKGEMVSELIAQGMDDVTIIATLLERGVEVTPKYVNHIRWSLQKYGVWNGRPPRKTPSAVKDTVKTETAKAIAERARELSEQGMSQRQIAERLGVPRTTLVRMLHATPNQPDPNQPKVLDMSEGTVNARVAGMVRGGYKVSEIMEECHVSKYRVTEVRKFLKDNGEKLPEHKGRGKKPPIVSENAIPEECEDFSTLTWAGAFRKLMEYCKAHGYNDAYYFAGRIAEDKDMRV